MADGTDAYKKVKEAGRYKEIKRTESVSTTDLLTRLLKVEKGKLEGEEAKHLSEFEGKKKSPYTSLGMFLCTTRWMAQFSTARVPTKDDVIVYVDGSFDLFHVGHAMFLKAAKALGTYVIVGLYDDRTVTQLKGQGHPAQSIHERVLSVLSCKYVDDVLLDAPFYVTDELIRSLRISFVVHGAQELHTMPEDLDSYKVPREMGIVRCVDSGSSLTTSDIYDRVSEQITLFMERNARKSKKEIDHMDAP